MATSLLLEGEDLEALLARAHAEGGANARIVRAEKVRRGGVMGFFARETFEVAVEIPDSGPEDDLPAALGSGARGRPDGRAVTSSRGMPRGGGVEPRPSTLPLDPGDARRGVRRTVAPAAMSRSVGSGVRGPGASAFEGPLTGSFAGADAEEASIAAALIDSFGGSSRRAPGGGTAAASRSLPADDAVAAAAPSRAPVSKPVSKPVAGSLGNGSLGPGSPGNGSLSPGSPGNGSLDDGSLDDGILDDLDSGHFSTTLPAFASLLAQLRQDLDSPAPETEPAPAQDEPARPAPDPAGFRPLVPAQREAYGLGRPEAPRAVAPGAPEAPRLLDLDAASDSALSARLADDPEPAIPHAPAVRHHAGAQSLSPAAQQPGARPLAPQQPLKPQEPPVTRPAARQQPSEQPTARQQVPLARPAPGGPGPATEATSPSTGATSPSTGATSPSTGATAPSTGATSPSTTRSRGPEQRPDPTGEGRGRGRGKGRQGGAAKASPPARPPVDPALAADRQALRDLGVPAPWIRRMRTGDRFTQVLRVLARMPEPSIDPDAPVVAVVAPQRSLLMEAHRVALELAVGDGPRPVVVLPAQDSARRRAAVEECHTHDSLVVATETLDYTDAERVRSTLREIRAQVVIAVLDAELDRATSEAWIRGIGRVDAVALEGGLEAGAPAACLGLGLPVIRMDGIPLDRVTWTALLCARLMVLDAAGTRAGSL